jgi:hypothetical protein
LGKIKALGPVGFSNANDARRRREKRGERRRYFKRKIVIPGRPSGPGEARAPK